MRMEQLEYILEIIRQKSFSMAANQLHISQQSLSQSVKNLEQELGVELFARTNRGVYQTRAGELVADFSREVLEQYGRLQKQLHNLEEKSECQETLSGKLIVYTCRIFYLSFLPDAVKTFLRKYPKAQLEIIEQDSKTIYTALETCSVREPDAESIGLVNLPYADSGILKEFAIREGYSFRVITSGKFKVLVSKDSKLASYKQISVRRIAQYPVIQYRTSHFENTPFFHLLEYYGYKTPHIPLSIDSFELWVEMIKSNLGIGFMHDVAYRRNTAHYDTLQQLSAVNIREVWGGTLGCVSSREGSALANAFLECLL